jgi:Holliday junction resolvase RusA-like endonuclease
MIDILFSVVLDPIAWARPRAMAQVDPATNKPQIRFFPQKSNARWAKDFAEVASMSAPETILTGPLRVDSLSVLRRPQRLMRRSDPPGLIEHESKPDSDNLRKAILDALKAWWRDDAQVCAGQSLKAYAEKGGLPRTIVRVRSMVPGGVEQIAIALGLIEPGARHETGEVLEQLTLVPSNEKPNENPPAANASSQTDAAPSVAGAAAGGFSLEY